MNDDLSPLEQELRALRPRTPSPGLRQRIALDLEMKSSEFWLDQWRVALAGGLAAACLAVVVVLSWLGEHEPTRVQDSTPKVATAPPLPTLQAYREALAQSPGAVDALLDEQARQSGQTGMQVKPVSAFTIADLRLLSRGGNRP